MRRIIFNEATINSIREFATNHTLMEACNRFTLKPKTLKRVAKEHSITFIIRESDIVEVVGSQRPKRYPLDSQKYGDVVEDGNGYLMCLKPDWYTGRKNAKYVFLHTLVMCEALGLTELPKGFCVHHIDFNRYNNDISNLALMTVSAHSKLHSLMNRKVQRSEKIRREEAPETLDNG